MITFKQYILESHFPVNLQIPWSVVTKITKPFFKKHIDELLSKLDKQSLPLFLEYANEYNTDDDLGPIFRVLYSNKNKFDVDGAINEIANWWYALYELNYEFYMEDSNIRDPIKLRDYAVSKVDELVMEAFNKFHKSKKFKIYTKQKKVKEIISKNNQSGWDL